MRVGLLVASFLLTVGSAPGSWAQGVTYDGCVDFRGVPVASVLNTAINDVAMATIVNGAPVIVYNTNVLARMKPQTRLFFYMHECGHHTLGHALSGNPMTQEQEADCWGIRELRKLGRVDDATVQAIQSDLVFSSGDWTHLPGPQRAINLAGCLTSDDGEGPSPRRSGGQDVALTFESWESSSGGSADFTVYIDGVRKGTLDNGGDDDELDLGKLSVGAHRFRLSDISIWSPDADPLDSGGWCEGRFEVEDGESDYELTLIAGSGGYSCRVR